MDQFDQTDPFVAARALAEPLAAASDEIEQTRRIPEPLLSQLHDGGLFRMLLPRDLGGGEVEPGAYVLALEEVAQHDASVAWNIFVANSSALIAPHLEQPAAREIFADPRTIIAWGPQTYTCDGV